MAPKKRKSKEKLEMKTQVAQRKQFGW